MKIFQLNVWGGRLEKQIASLITEQDPDVICLQEAISIEGGSAAFFLTVEEIAELTGMQAIFSPVISFKLMNRTAGWGNAILTKLPVKSHKTVFTGKQFIEHFDTLESEDYNIRNLLHAELESDEGPVHVLTHHGHHVPAHKNGDEETMRQCKIIADYINKLDGKIILTGDFNLAPHSDSLEQINALLRNACIKHDIKTTRNQLTHKTEVCDYIFTSDAVNVQDFAVLPDMASDHLALVMRCS